MAVTELLAPVPVAADYSVSVDLWQRLEDEITTVSSRIDAGDELIPNDVTKIRELKKQVDAYVTSFNKAMREAQSEYRKMIDRRLAEIGFGNIEEFVQKKRQEQTETQNARISYKMGTLKEISDGLLERTVKLKDTSIASELLPAFTARFPKVQSGAKDNDITNWVPYFSVIQKTMTIMDAFLKDVKYADAVLLPVYSTTMRELLAYAKDGSDKHLVELPDKYRADAQFIKEIKLKTALKTKADGISRIAEIIKDLDDTDNINSSVKQIRTEQAWEEISLIVRLVNNS